MSVSLIARQEGMSASLLFQWRQGALTAVSADEAVVPASELAAARAEIAELQRVVGKKTLKNEILKEAVEYGATKKVDCALIVAFVARDFLPVRCDHVSQSYKCESRDPGKGGGFLDSEQLDLGKDRSRLGVILSSPGFACKVR
jgi:transposase